MTATLTRLDERTIKVPRLSIQQRVARIEDMASATGLTRDMTLDLLRTVAADSLRGDEDALWEAWRAAENAIAARDATDPSDGDYEGYEERAEARIHDLIHGPMPARGSRINHNGGLAG